MVNNIKKEKNHPWVLGANELPYFYFWIQINEQLFHVQYTQVYFCAVLCKNKNKQTKKKQPKLYAQLYVDKTDEAMFDWSRQYGWILPLESQV